MGLGNTLMKVAIKIRDVVEMVQRFEENPAEAMREMVTEVQKGFRRALERVMDAEIALFLGDSNEGDNKRNGYTTRTFAVKGIGAIEIRMPRDRKGRYVSKVVPPRRRYDEAIEKDLALLNLAGLSTRMLSLLSKELLGIKVSAQEVSNAMDTILPAAKAFLERPLTDRKFKYLYIDGTNFNVRRSTVAKEPTLVVLGVDDTDRKSVLAMVGGDKENRTAWEMVFASLKERGLDASAIELGIMDGLPGLMDAFSESFTRARIARCWVHKARNVLPRVPKRYQAAFKSDWDHVQYAEGRAKALAAYNALESRWRTVCSEAVECLSKDIEALLVHYEFPKELWDALRTTNPIERVNKEFKRRSKSMEVVGPTALNGLLAFTAMRLEYGWRFSPITNAGRFRSPKQFSQNKYDSTLEIVEQKLLNQGWTQNN